MRKLTNQELDELSEIATKAAENFIFSNISKKEIADLNINLELNYEDTLDVDITIDLDLDELSSVNENIIVEKAIDEALDKISEFIY